MADKTLISWTNATWNPITGCMVKSPGCLRCYAMLLAGTRLKHSPSREGLTREVNGHHVWTGEVRFNMQWLEQPLRWKRPRDIFVVAHGDLFYEAVNDWMITSVFEVIQASDWHRMQVLTKRPERAVSFLPDRFDPMKHVLIGTSVERQQEADERRPHLEALARLGWNTWVSYEPALGPVDWSGWEFIRWMVSGGESGPDARPSHPDWHRITRDWCAANSVPYFFKQWGNWAPVIDAEGYIRSEGGGSRGALWENDRWTDFPTGQRHGDVFHLGKARAGALLDGVEHKAMP